MVWSEWIIFKWWYGREWVFYVGVGVVWFIWNIVFCILFGRVVFCVVVFFWWYVFFDYVEMEVFFWRRCFIVFVFDWRRWFSFVVLDRWFRFIMFILGGWRGVSFWVYLYWGGGFGMCWCGVWIYDFSDMVLFCGFCMKMSLYIVKIEFLVIFDIFNFSFVGIIGMINIYVIIVWREV